MNHSSSILNQIIESQRSVNDKSGLGYKAAVINDGSSSSLKETGAEKKNEKGADKNSVVEKQEEKSRPIVQKRTHDGYQNKFNGYCFFFVTIMDTRLRFVLNFQEKYMNIMVMRSLDMDMEKDWM